MTFSINREEFEAWINTRHATEFVGRPVATGCCPIANYLNQKNDKPRTWCRVLTKTAIRDATGYSANLNPEILPLPLWAATFIGKVDDLVDTHHHITAAQAKDILNSIP